jgi:Transglycosylase SLT domain
MSLRTLCGRVELCRLPDMSIPFLACMAAAASFYHLPPRVLPAIQAVERGRPGLIQPNANGTADLGLMQINSIWIEPLARFAQMPAQTVAYRLLDDPCFNIAAAAAIMRAYLSEAQGKGLSQNKRLGRKDSRVPQQRNERIQNSRCESGVLASILTG